MSRSRRSRAKGESQISLGTFMLNWGARLAFLVFGPMIDLKNIGLLMTIFRGRAIVYLFVLAAQLTFLLTLLINLYVS